MDDFLLNCERKLHRIDRQLADLKTLIVNYLNDPQRLVIEHEIEGREIIFKVAGVVEPPVEISLIAGEILHNFRCVLDYLVWGMVGKTGNEPTTSHQFPIYNVEPMKGVADRKRLRYIEPSGVALIDALQPYRYQEGIPEMHPLWHLNAFNNADKHRFLHVAYDTSLKANKLIAGGEYEATSVLQTGALKPGAKLFVVTAKEPSEPHDLRVYATVQTDVAFRLEVRDKTDALDVRPALLVPVFNGFLRIRSYFHEHVLSQQGLGGALGWNRNRPFDEITRTLMAARSFGVEHGVERNDWSF